jgi:phosphoribosylaminoimidazolecarboxamide formyltransferase/IMP cyclohydrolase
MVRAPAKNYANVAIVTSPSRYAQVLDAVASGGFTLEERAALAAEAFSHTATYDIAVASWLGSVVVPPADGCGVAPAGCPALRGEPAPGRCGVRLGAS